MELIHFWSRCENFLRVSLYRRDLNQRPSSYYSDAPPAALLSHRSSTGVNPYWKSRLDGIIVPILFKNHPQHTMKLLYNKSKPGVICSVCNLLLWYNVPSGIITRREHLPQTSKGCREEIWS